MKLGSRETQQSYDHYADLLGPINADFPQHQGLTEVDFEQALSDPHTACTTIRQNGSTILLPQLTSPEVNGWLHDEYYASKFAKEFASDDVLEYTHLPAITPGQQVRDRLSDLATRNGVLVYDYPDVDGEFEGELFSVLDSEGISRGDPDVLGTQTYHVGRVQLKRDHKKRQTHMPYIEAFEMLVREKAYDKTERNNGVWIHRRVDGEDAERLQEFYDDAYETISDHPCEQGLTPDEFSIKLVDEEVAKAVYRKNGVAESLCLVTENLSTLTWVNEGYYRSNHFKDRFGPGAVTWYPGIATDPSPEIQGHNMPAIISLFTKLSEVGDNEHLVVFDTPDVNTGYLDGALDVLINGSPEAGIDFTRIGQQVYSAVRLSKN